MSSCEQRLTACEGGAVTLIKEPPRSALAVTPSPFICPSLPNPASPHTAAAATATLSPKERKKKEKAQPKVEPRLDSSFNRLSDEPLTGLDGKRTNETQPGRFSTGGSTAGASDRRVSGCRGKHLGHEALIRGGIIKASPPSNPPALIQPQKQNVTPAAN